MRGLLKLCSANPVRSPSRNKNIPCHSRRRFASSVLWPKPSIASNFVIRYDHLVRSVEYTLEERKRGFARDLRRGQRPSLRPLHCCQQSRIGVDGLSFPP